MWPEVVKMRTIFIISALGYNWCCSTSKEKQQSNITDQFTSPGIDCWLLFFKFRGATIVQFDPFYFSFNTVGLFPFTPLKVIV